MADDSIMCTQVEMLQKAGVNVNSLLNAATDTTFVYSNAFIGQAEGTINSMTRYNWSDAYTAGLNSDVEGLLTEATSNLAAIYCINFDMDAIGRSVAESMITVLRDAALRNIQILRNIKVQSFVNAA